MTRFRSAFPALASLVLVLGVTLAGLAAAADATSTAMRIHRADQERLQANLAGLGDGYLLFGFKELDDLATSGSWSLAPGAPADVTRMRAYVTAPTSLQNYGAALVNLSGHVISSWAPSTGLPDPNDPGFVPLRAALLSGNPGLSSVMRVHGIAVVAYAVPIMENGQPVAVLAAFDRTDQSAFQNYVATLRQGRTGYTTIVDSVGTVVASAQAAQIGHTFPGTQLLAAQRRSPEGFLDYRGADGRRWVASYHSLSFGGWGGFSVQSEAEFFGPIHRQGLYVAFALLALLVMAGALIMLFHHRRHLALRRELRTMTDLWEAREQFRHAFEETPVGMALVDVSQPSRGKLIQVNRSLADLTGYTRAELEQRTFQDITNPADQTSNAALAAQLIDGAVTSYEIEIRLMHADGHPVWVLLHGSLVRDPEDRPMYGIAQVQDVTARKQAEERLAHLAFHDPLTGLSNRRLLMDRLGQALAASSRHRNQVGLLYVDLDRFKQVNDSYGHEMGDRVLVEMARRIEQVIRVGDTAARLGGDEFVIMCPALTSAEEAIAVAERVAEVISEPITIEGTTTTLTGSIGISLGGGMECYAEVLLRDADTAMYNAKQSNTLRYGIATASTNS